MKDTRLIGGLLVAALAFILPALAQAPAKSLDDNRRLVLMLVNAERDRAGCAPLRADPRLAHAAQGHAEAMARGDFFDHVGLDGGDMVDRVRAQAYAFSRLAENLAAGWPDAESVVEGWMSSPGHRANILDCRVVETGVGHVHDPRDTPFAGGLVGYRHYWVQVFGAPR
jgi:uncharacterized protein YkwD